jgi:hypothetical protein
MKISGFTFIRNAVKFDYPVVESILSILPLCDEFIVAVGKSDDGTRDLISSIGSPKIRIIDTVWDETLREGGQVLAVETDKAFDAVSPGSTWAFYIQADEVVHEKSHDLLRQAMERWKDEPAVEGLLLSYVHFYGSYDFYGDSRKWYRNEVRIIRNDKQIRSYKDAQGFRNNGKPLQVKKTGATIHHYGWVKPPESQKTKLRYFHTLWHDAAWLEKNRKAIEGFDYSQIDSLSRFNGTHPAVMKERIASRNWEFDIDPSRKKFSMLSRFLHFLEAKTGYRVGEYRNYKLI